MFINYPNNPTAAIADKGFYKEVVDFAKDNNLIVCSDLAYSEIYYGGNKPPSFFEVNGAMDVGIEMHSFSKTYNMCGWRLGVAYGNPEIVAGLAKVKENIDSGVFEAVQLTGKYALENFDGAPAMPEYERRMNTLVEAFNSAGIEAKMPNATFYLWARVPEGYNSKSFATKVLEEEGVVVTPGSAFGEYGEGYFRASITSSTERIEEAAERIKKLK
jgi:LL-diaminopimelate aminotransferase